MIGTIAAREFKALFLSPMAWSILAVVQLIIAYLFLAQLDTYMQLAPRLAGIAGAPGVTDLVVAPVFGNAAVILLLSHFGPFCRYLLDNLLLFACRRCTFSCLR